jgi:hypothetical protein
MAKKDKDATKSTSLTKKIATLVVMLLTGGGVGGWQLSDHPTVQKILALFMDSDALGENGEGGTLAAVAKQGVKTLISAAEDTSRAGVYEVRINEVHLDSRAFRKGQELDIKVRIRSVPADGPEVIAWNSADFGQNLAVVGRDELSASWKNRPFMLGWSPGDRLVLEVYGRRGFREVTYYRSELESDSQFPFKSGKQLLVCLIPDAPVGNPEDSRVVFASKRVGDRPATPGAASQVAREGDGDSATTSRRARRVQ